MAQQSNRPPSELLQVDSYVRYKYGVSGWWTCIQIDHAVYAFGSRVDGLLSEFRKNGKPKYKLETLLGNSSSQPMTKQVTRLSRNGAAVSAKPTRKSRQQEAVKE